MVAVFSPRALARFRALSLRSMDATAVVSRPGGSDGTFGGSSAPTVIVSGVPCRVTPRGPGREAFEQGGVESTAPWEVRLDGIRDVRSTDTVEVTWLPGSSRDGETAEFQVEAVLAPGSYSVQTCALCTHPS